MKLIKKIITFRTFMNKLLKIPFRTKFTKLSNGLVTEIHSFEYKQVVKVKFNTKNRFLRPI